MKLTSFQSNKNTNGPTALHNSGCVDLIKSDKQIRTDSVSLRAIVEAIDNELSEVDRFGKKTVLIAK